MPQDGSLVGAKLERYCQTCASPGRRRKRRFGQPVLRTTFQPEVIDSGRQVARKLSLVTGQAGYQAGLASPQKMALTIMSQGN